MGLSFSFYLKRRREELLRVQIQARTEMLLGDPLWSLLFTHSILTRQGLKEKPSETPYPQLQLRHNKRKFGHIWWRLVNLHLQSPIEVRPSVINHHILTQLSRPPNLIITDT